MTRLEFAIAWRYLRGRRGSSVLSLSSIIAIGGVIVGVSALILVIGVMTGMQREMREKILIGFPDMRVLNSYGTDVRVDAWRAVLGQVRSQPGVVAAEPFVMLNGIVSRPGNSFTSHALIVGIDPDGPDAAPVTDIRSFVEPGKGDFRFVSSDAAEPGIVLGTKLAADLLVMPGDKVAMFALANTPVNPAIGFSVPMFRTFEVTGIFNTGMYDYDQNYAYISLATAQKLAGLDSAVSGIQLKVADRSHVSTLATQLRSILGSDYRTRTWEDDNQSFFSALALEKVAMALILLLIVVVASFSIVGMLTMMVADKTREIGILRAMGMRGASIRRIFFIQGIVIGLVGTGTGLAIGLAGSYALRTWQFLKLPPEIYLLDHLPVATDPLDVFGIVFASMAIAALATLYPAMQAARLYPLEAIRHE